MSHTYHTCFSRNTPNATITQYSVTQYSLNRNSISIDSPKTKIYSVSTDSTYASQKITGTIQSDIITIILTYLSGLN